MGSIEEQVPYDVVVVGGGFGGIHTLYHLRKFGFSVRMFEAGAALGGTWYWNCYPGARVDTDVPVYQFSAAETWDEWEWSERYPERNELQKYFSHVDKVWNLSRDISYNSRVTAAQWDIETNLWNITLLNSNDNTTSTSSTRFIIFCTGLASNPYMPNIKGVDKFKGFLSHTARWPQNGVDLKDKRVGVIGTGATGVQVIQESGPIVSHLTVFQRTPNTALPMKQESISKTANREIKKEYPETIRHSLTTWAGFLYGWDSKSAMEETEEARQVFFEQQWKKGGFHFWVGNYKDIAFDLRANHAAYDFWRKKVVERIHDPVIAEKLAPLVPLHPLGTKRPSLERTYYEVFNQSNVDLVDLSENPIEEITETGVTMKNGEKIALDAIVFATGFDAVSGGLTAIDIRGTTKTTIKDKWANGIFTYLGMTTRGFPNMFFVYGPQAPTGFANGPTCCEAQGEWIVHTLRYLRREEVTTIEATAEAEAEWRKHVLDMGSAGLFKDADSWYYGANIPGKPREILNYMAGMPAYKEKCWSVAAKGYEGFVLK